MKKTMTSEAPMNVSKTIKKDKSPNDRLEEFKSTLQTSDIIISLHMGLGVSSVTSHMPSGSNRKINIDWLNLLEKAFPFINKSYMLDGKGELLLKWSSQEQINFVHSTEWYKSKEKSVPKTKDIYASQDLVNKALKNKPFLEILIEIYKKKFGAGLLATEVNTKICKRIRAIRESQEGLSGGSKCTQEDFAKMLNVTRSMIVSIELARQSPSTHFIQRLGHDFSDEPGMGLKHKGKSVRVSYDWLFDGKGEMFQLHNLEVDDDKESMKEELRVIKEKYFKLMEKTLNQ
jgi:transcriptional regulator with XRE-family HTH domain|tara:strand:- start:320 stop:1183 length:864 start_codon:yes stop_codon:yes gene_type:complete